MKYKIIISIFILFVCFSEAFSEQSFKASPIVSRFRLGMERSCWCDHQQCRYHGTFSSGIGYATWTYPTDIWCQFFWCGIRLQSIWKTIHWAGNPSRNLQFPLDLLITNLTKSIFREKEKQSLKRKMTYGLEKMGNITLSKHSIISAGSGQISVYGHFLKMNTSYINAGQYTSEDQYVRVLLWVAKITSE